MRNMTGPCKILVGILAGICLFQAAQAGEVSDCCPVLELRQYTLHPGKRDVLIELFDREFVESQEELGMKLVGQFRDLDRSDRFVWLRGFQDMAGRKEQLTAFYSGPVWKANSKAANATMIDASNVLLLRPLQPASGFSLLSYKRLPRGTNDNTGGILIATIHYLSSPADKSFVDFFEGKMKPVITDAGDSVVAYFTTEYSENTFPALPVREGEHAFVVFSLFPDLNGYEKYSGSLSRSKRWNEVSNELKKYLKASSEVLKLSPTSRSLLHD